MLLFAQAEFPHGLSEVNISRQTIMSGSYWNSLLLRMFLSHSPPSTTAFTNAPSNLSSMGPTILTQSSSASTEHKYLPLRNLRILGSVYESSGSTCPVLSTRYVVVRLSTAKFFVSGREDASGCYLTITANIIATGKGSQSWEVTR